MTHDGLDWVRDLLRKRAAKFAKRRKSTGQRAWGDAHGIPPSRVSEFLSGKRLPTRDILDALNLEWRVCRKAATLPTREVG